MKKIQYIAPMIDVFNVDLQGFIATSGDSVTFNNREIEEDEVGIDNKDDDEGFPNFLLPLQY